MYAKWFDKTDQDLSDESAITPSLFGEDTYNSLVNSGEIVEIFPQIARMIISDDTPEKRLAFVRQFVSNKFSIGKKLAAWIITGKVSPGIVELLPKTDNIHSAGPEENDLITFSRQKLSPEHTFELDGYFITTPIRTVCDILSSTLYLPGEPVLIAKPIIEQNAITIDDIRSLVNSYGRWNNRNVLNENCEHVFGESL